MSFRNDDARVRTSHAPANGTIVRRKAAPGDGRFLAVIVATGIFHPITLFVFAFLIVFLEQDLYSLRSVGAGALSASICRLFLFETLTKSFQTRILASSDGFPDAKELMPVSPSSGPTVSVIIPTWNRADTIVAAVESVLSQTYPPLEILVCDDGSSDDTEARLQTLHDPRIRWLPGPRRGLPAIPCNRGIAAARGEWLAFLDSDDTWVPEKLERQMTAVMASGRLASCTNSWSISPNNDVRHSETQEDRVLTFEDMIHANSVICCSALVHRSLFAIVEGFPEKKILIACEDYACWLRVASLTDFDYLGAPLVVYMDSPATSVRSRRSKKGKFTKSGLYVPVLQDYLEWRTRVKEGALRPELTSLRIIKKILYIMHNQKKSSRYKKALLCFIFKIYFNKFFGRQP